jgi:hypothetical protein
MDFGNPVQVLLMVLIPNPVHPVNPVYRSLPSAAVFVRRKGCKTGDVIGQD